jgi:hypothetical protein
MAFSSSSCRFGEFRNCCHVFAAGWGRYAQVACAPWLNTIRCVSESFFLSVSGWLARMQGEYYKRARVKLEPLRAMGAALDADWQAALTAFHAARHRATH